MNRKNLFLSFLLSSILLTSCGSKKDNSPSNSSGGGETSVSPDTKYTMTPRILSSISNINFNSILSINDDGIYTVAHNQSFYFYKNNEPLKLIYGQTFPLMNISSNGSTTCETYMYINTQRPRSACYGKNNHFQLGNGSNLDSTIPTIIGQTEFEFEQIVVSKNDLVCGESNGSIYCWGKNAIKDGEILKDAMFPVEIENLKDRIDNVSEIPQISVGDNYVCYITRDTKINGVWCSNIYSPTHSSSPIMYGNFNAISSDGSHTCALDSEGYAWCMGTNKFGELGDGSNIDSEKPVRVKIVSNFKSISVSESTTCGLTTNNEAWCWGKNNESQIGNGILESSNIPIKVKNINYLSSIKVSEHRTCAIDINSKIWCWGKGEWN